MIELPDLVPYEGRVWSEAQTTSDIVEVKENACGRALFAKRAIKKSEQVVRFSAIISMPGFDPGTRDGYVTQADETHFFLGIEGALDNFANHSCDPSVRLSDDATWFVALRDLQVGDEIAYDYATTDNVKAWVIPCLCGAANCRGFVGYFDGLSREEQVRIAPFCLPYLRKKLL